MAPGWNHNRHYDDFVLRQAPSPCASSLDVGCGEGDLARSLAEICGHAVGIDADLAVVARLHASRGSGANPCFLLGDVMTYPFADGFDLVTAVATLHHLPLEGAILRLRDLLKPGGVLVIVGLYRATSLADHLLSAVGFVGSRALRLTHGFAQVTAPMRDPVESLAEIRAVAAAHLPGADLRRRLLFRYTLRWEKPRAAA